MTDNEIIDMRESNIRLLGLLADIRAAVGDPTGMLMQDELVERCRKLAACARVECCKGCPDCTGIGVRDHINFQASYIKRLRLRENERSFLNRMVPVFRRYGDISTAEIIQGILDRHT
jgi:hypothetical protein